MENVSGSFSFKKLCFLCLKHITPDCSQNKILAVKKLGKSLHTSVFGGVNISENLGKEVVLPALSLITPLIIIYSQVSMYSKLSKELLNNVMRLT